MQGVPLLVRKLCEAYMGLDPIMIQHWTLDMLYLMTVPVDEIKSGGKRMSVAAAVAGGFVDPKKVPSVHGGASYFQRMKAKLANKSQPAGDGSLSKRQRRRQRIDELKKRIATGDV